MTQISCVEQVLSRCVNLCVLQIRRGCVEKASCLTRMYGQFGWGRVDL